MLKLIDPLPRVPRKKTDGFNNWRFGRSGIVSFLTVAYNPKGYSTIYFFYYFLLNLLCIIFY